MPKRKDSFICNWTSVSGQLIRERVVLYEADSSIDDSHASSESSTCAYNKGPHSQQIKDSNEQKNLNDRRIMFRGFMSVIYICLEELSVLKSFCRRPYELVWNEPLVYKDLAQRYDLFDESYDIFKLDDMRKSLKDISILFNILARTFLEMQKEEKFTILEKSADILTQQIQDEDCLMDVLKFMCKYKNYLKLALVREKSESSKELQNISDDANKSKLIYADVLGFSRCEYSYNSDWEAARVEQKLWSVRKETQSLEEAIQKYKDDIQNENRVHNEIENYCSEYIEDLNKQIAEWQTKYDSELETCDSNLIYLKNELELLVVKLADIHILYDTRKEQMDDWIEYRTQKKIADDLETRINQAVTKIQAWWRGVMFRKNLGIQRKRKKGKKGGKKGGKTNKK